MNQPSSLLDIISQVDATHARNAAEVVRLQKVLDDKADDHKRILAELKEVKQWLHEARLQNAHRAAEIKKLSKELDRARGMLAAHNPLSDELLKLVSTMNSSNAGAVKSEPSRLEIAAMLMSASLSRMVHDWNTEEEAYWAVELADALIKAARQ
jgi:predicted  nucleic acid-binding Zn-ribbon protein